MFGGYKKIPYLYKKLNITVKNKFLQKDEHRDVMRILWWFFRVSQDQTGRPQTGDATILNAFMLPGKPSCESDVRVWLWRLPTGYFITTLFLNNKLTNQAMNGVEMV